MIKKGIPMLTPRIDFFIQLNQWTIDQSVDMVKYVAHRNQWVFKGKFIRRLTRKVDTIVQSQQQQQVQWIRCSENFSKILVRNRRSDVFKLESVLFQHREQTVFFSEGPKYYSDMKQLEKSNTRVKFACFEMTKFAIERHRKMEGMFFNP